MEYKQVKIKEICSYALFKEIKAHAMGSPYRLNATTCDCYAFNLDYDLKDWLGGWDWSNELTGYTTDFILMLKDSRDLKQGKVYKVQR